MEFEKHALILGVIEGLHSYGSWTGKTHVQKALSLLDATGDIPVPFQFILYKHGPYSFDIEDELEQMKAYAAIVIDTIPGHGVTLRTGVMADFLKRKAPLSAAQKHAINRVCAFVGESNVLELERLATAAWIRTREAASDNGAVAARLHTLKPHVSVQEALEADKKVAVLLTSAV